MMASATQELAEIEDVSFADPAFLADPWTPLIRLQEEAPVYYSKNQGGWIISRHEDVRAAFADRRLSAARVEQFFRGMPPEVQEQTEGGAALQPACKSTGSTGATYPRPRAAAEGVRPRRDRARSSSLSARSSTRSSTNASGSASSTSSRSVSAVLPTRVMQRLFDLPDEYRPLLFKLAVGLHRRQRRRDGHARAADPARQVDPRR